MQSTEHQSIQQLAADTIRILSAEAVQKANSGHPGMPMGMADCAVVLWRKFLSFNPEEPDWINRDRFILSAGHGSMLLYALLHLSGYDITMDDIKQFRQWGSVTPGHPEYRCVDGVEMTTGPLGQGFATGVGMAIAAKMMAERLNRDKPLFGNHRIYALVSDGDMMEGISHEAASLAGHLKLGNLIYIYDDNQISIEGSTELAFSEDVGRRFEAYGWSVQKVDGHNHTEIEEALSRAVNEQEKPSLIIARTHIAYGSPAKQDTAGSHGAPLGEDEIAATKQKLGWPAKTAFHIPEEVKSFFKERVQELLPGYRQWQKDFRHWQQQYPDLAVQLDEKQQEKILMQLEEELFQELPAGDMATRKASGAMMQKIARQVAGFCGGSADLSPSTKTNLADYESIRANHFGGRNLHFGVREHAMAAISNGIALYGGFYPYCSTFLQFADYLRPALRLSAMMGLPVTYVFSHDSIFLGEDGPTHQPVEHIASLRAIPNLSVIRPADALELAGAWSYALKNRRGPTAIMLTRQGVPQISRPAGFDPGATMKGGYVLRKEKGKVPELLIVATGSEVQIALQAGEKLAAEGRSVRIVSMPSVEIFRRLPVEDQGAVIPSEPVRTVVIEAARPLGWGDLLRSLLLVIALDDFGRSAPHKVLAEKFGFTVAAVLEKIRNWMSD